MTIIDDKEISQLKILQDKEITDPVDLTDTQELERDIKNKSIKEYRTRISNTKTRKIITNIRIKLRYKRKTIKIQLGTIYDNIELASNSEVQKEIDKELKKIYQQKDRS